MGVEEDKDDPMTTVGAWGGRSNSCPACIDGVVLDIGVATGGGIEGCKVTTPGGCQRLRDNREGVESNGGEAVPPPQVEFRQLCQLRSANAESA